MKAARQSGLLAMVVGAAMAAAGQVAPGPGSDAGASAGSGLSASGLSASGLGASGPGASGLNGPVMTAAEPVAAAVAATRVVSPVEALGAFQDADVKFDVRALMDILRDKRHEGWVLAAYPDPKTSEPLIGAGFTLDLPERAHAQTDAMNTHPFIEPSSEQLWLAAGLPAERLHSILADYNERLATWKKRRFRRKIVALTPEISEPEARQLLRVAVIQAIYNAKGYCRNFDRFSAPQQMALTQLVYQMGVNLTEFSQFLNLVNSDAVAAPRVETGASVDADYWTSVQGSLIASQWARKYRTRAVSVIAMLDPQYADGPNEAERRVSLTLRPAVLRRGRGRATLRTAASARPATKARRGKRLRRTRG